MKNRAKDEFGFIDFDNFDPGLMGDPSAYGLMDWGNLFGDFEIPSPEWGDGAPPPTSGDFGGIDITGGDSGGFSLGSIAQQALRALGLLNGNGSGGSGGGLNLGALIPMIAGGVGAFNANIATNEATDAMLASNREAVGYLQGREGQQRADYKPWTDAGLGALGQIQNMPASNLASRYKPLGSGRGMTLGNLARGR